MRVDEVLFGFGRYDWSSVVRCKTTWSIAKFSVATSGVARLAWHFGPAPRSLFSTFPMTYPSFASVLLFEYKLCGVTCPFQFRMIASSTSVRLGGIIGAVLHYAVCRSEEADLHEGSVLSACFELRLQFTSVSCIRSMSKERAKDHNCGLQSWHTNCPDRSDEHQCVPVRVVLG